MPMISRFHGACSFFAWFTSHDSHDTDGRFENVFVTVRRTRAAPSLRRPYGRPGRPVTGVAWLLRVCAVSPFVSLWAPAPRTGCWQLDTSLGTGANLTAKSPGFRSSGPGFAMLFDSLWFSLILFAFSVYVDVSIPFFFLWKPRCTFTCKAHLLEFHAFGLHCIMIHHDALHRAIKVNHWQGTTDLLSE